MSTVPASHSADRKKLIATVLMLAAGIAVLLVLNVFLVRRVALGQPDPIAVTDRGEIIPLVPLNESYATEARVLTYAQQCMFKAFSHDFVHYKATFEESTRCFTPDGVDSYAKVMQPLLIKLRKSRMVMSITEKPFVVARSGPLGGVYTWEVHGTVTLYMMGTTEELPPQAFDAVIYVVRVPMQENIRGIALNSINLSPVLAASSN